MGRERRAVSTTRAWKRRKYAGTRRDEHPRRRQMRLFAFHQLNVSAPVLRPVPSRHPAGQAAKLFSAIPVHLLDTVELRTAISSRERGKRHLYIYIDVNTVSQGSSSEIVSLYVLTCSSSAAHAYARPISQT